RGCNAGFAKRKSRWQGNADRGVPTSDGQPHQTNPPLARSPLRQPRGRDRRVTAKSGSTEGTDAASHIAERTPARTKEGASALAGARDGTPAATRRRASPRA